MERDPHAAAAFSDEDDDDDLEALVPDKHIPHPPLPQRRSTFSVAATAVASSVAGNRRVWILIVAVGLPVLAALFFFAFFRGGAGADISGVRLPSASAAVDERMREAELRALLLLKNQHLGLVNLWNHTLPPASGDLNGSKTGNTSSSPSTISASLSTRDLRAALLESIKINNEIQRALLSAHRSSTANASQDAQEDNAGLDLLDFGANECPKTEKIKDRRTIEWNPSSNKFLLAMCFSGQMSNHLICLEKHMFFAALLGRTLVLPSPHLDYQYDRVLDIEHINKCFGKKVVMLFEEFEELKKKKVSIDRLICYAASPPCYLDEDHIKKLKGIGISLGKIEAAFPEDAGLKEPKKRLVGDVVPKFSTDAEVLAVGDLYYADVEDEWVMQPGGPLAHKCETLIQPNRFIILTAQRFVQTYLGSSFVALHFRRHGFLQFCNVKKESCFFPVPQAAECIQKVVERANAPVIYLSTDAADSEANLLQSLVRMDDKPIPLVRRPEHSSTEKWDALLYRNHLGGDAQVEAMLDKTICAMSSVFVGAPGSTFTDDILRLRRGWGSASQCDEFLCQGEQPNYVAELE